MPVATQPQQRTKLERLCRYVARPPLALERFSVTNEGKLRYALKNPYANGTTHFLFEPLDFIAKLAALVPKPRVNLVRYHGVFAPNSKLRRRIVPAKNSLQPARPKHKDQHQKETTRKDEALSHPKRLSWAERLSRTFEFDVTICALCGGSLRVIADITEPHLIDKILSHIKQTRAPPAQAQRRVTPTSVNQQTQGTR